MYDPQANSLTEIALTSTILGVIVGGCIFSLGVSSFHSAYSNLYAYFILLCTYYLFEFIQTARYQPSKVTAKLFLIWGGNGNREFLMVQFLNIWEYFFTQSRFNSFLPNWNSSKLTSLGLTMSILGQLLRYKSMEVCGSSFSHYIAVDKPTKDGIERPLIKHGPYAYSRHPSYVGFWYFVVGMEILLGNCGCLVMSVAILTVFFRKRIQFEEWFLENRIYGEEYTEYKRHVSVWIPFVVGI